VYCILCKQTCMNPNPERYVSTAITKCNSYLTIPFTSSWRRGWDLLCLCLQYFPPTKDLESWMYSYFEENKKAATQANDKEYMNYVNFAIRRLAAICRDGAR